MLFDVNTQCKINGGDSGIQSSCFRNIVQSQSEAIATAEGKVKTFAK